MNFADFKLRWIATWASVSGQDSIVLKPWGLSVSLARIKDLRPTGSVKTAPFFCALFFCELNFCELNVKTNARMPPAITVDQCIPRQKVISFTKQQLSISRRIVNIDSQAQP
jgi:hypothetical protein